MKDPYTGGCACGAIRYETTSEPIVELHCQCCDCQRRSGAGHSSYLTFAQRSEMRISGAATSWRVGGESGNEKIHSFCPVCGAPVYLTFAVMPDLIAVHAASLDDPGRFQPSFITYGIRARAWDRMDPALRRFDRMPPDT